MLSPTFVGTGVLDCPSLTFTTARHIHNHTHVPIQFCVLHLALFTSELDMKKIDFFDKAYIGRAVLYAILTVLTIGGILYIGYHMTGDTRGGIDTVYAVSDTISRSVKGDAYIIRDEHPISQNIDSGYLSPTMRDGDKVRVGAKVADIYNTSSATVSAKINLIEEQIAFYEKCKDSHATVGDTSSVHREISESVIEFRRRTAGGDVSYAKTVKPSLTMAVRKLGVLTGRVTDFSAQITSLEGELASLKASLGATIGSVYAPSSGYYFSTTDGYENIFSSRNIDSVTYSDITDMISSAESAKPESGSAGKIVSSFKWYVACKMTSAESGKFKVDNTYSIKLKNNSDTPLDMKVYKVLSNASEAVVLFECTNIREGYDYTRLQEFEAEYEEIKSFKVPVSALRIHEDMQGVFILDEVTVKFRKVTVIDEENGFYLCYAEDPDDTGEAEPEESTENSETADESGESGGTYYAYLRENDLVISSGTGLYVGMTYNPTK